MIVAAALDMLAERGIESLTLRNLAAALNVRAPSLYWHVASKQELFGYLSEQIFRDVLDQLPASGDWRAWLRALGIGVWQKQRDLRDVRALMMQSEMDPDIQREFNTRMVERLVALGMEPAIAFDAQRSVVTLATGWTIMDDPKFRDEPPEPSFLNCLDALIRGWEHPA
jgi:TetR/AcrR family tetracycline transcriptional repressor